MAMAPQSHHLSIPSSPVSLSLSSLARRFFGLPQSRHSSRSIRSHLRIPPPTPPAAAAAAATTLHRRRCSIFFDPSHGRHAFQVSLTFSTMASSDSASVPAAASASNVPSAEGEEDSLVNNPLLNEDSSFPCFDAVEAKHVVPGIRAILKQLVSSIPLAIFLYDMHHLSIREDYSTLNIWEFF